MIQGWRQGAGLEAPEGEHEAEIARQRGKA